MATNQLVSIQVTTPSANVVWYHFTRLYIHSKHGYINSKVKSLLQLVPVLTHLNHLCYLLDAPSNSFPLIR